MFGLGTALVVLLAAAPPSPEAIARAQRDVLQDEDYQKSFDGDERRRRAREEPARRERARNDWEPVRPRREDPAPAPETTDDTTTVPRQERRTPRSRGDDDGSALGTILWLAIGAITLLLLFAFLRAWMRSPTRDLAKKKSAPAARKPLAPAALERPLTEAERLAAEGRYAEAVHVLLLETMAALHAHSTHGLHASWTSREVLREAQMPAPAEQALGRLVKTVEQSLFGRRAVDKFDFARSFDAFKGFRDAYRGATS